MKNCKYWIIFIFSVVVSSCSLPLFSLEDIEANYCMSLIERHVLIVNKHIMLCKKDPNEKCVNKTEAYTEILESFSNMCKEDYFQQ